LVTASREKPWVLVFLSKGHAYPSGRIRRVFGSVAEWSIAPVLKTGNGQPFVSSNLTASASFLVGLHPQIELFLFQLD
jgi:hypothetical protein